VDRTRPDHHEQATIAPADDVADDAPLGADELGLGAWQGQLFEQDGGRDQGPEPLDADIVGAVDHGASSVGWPGVGDQPRITEGEPFRSPPHAARTDDSRAVANI
jgi:hypothetical protein